MKKCCYYFELIVKVLLLIALLYSITVFSFVYESGICSNITTKTFKFN